MMFRLISDVIRGCINSRNANAEPAIAFLLFEASQFWERFVNPFGGVAFEKLDGFREGKS